MYNLRLPTSAVFSVFLVLLGAGMPLFSFAAKKKEKAITRHTYDLFFTQYEEAKAAYKAGDYSKAKIAFAELRQAEFLQAVMPYIHFYYALAAYHDGEKSLASQTFDWLYHTFPSWDKKEEVCYWAAHCKFQDQRFSEALQLLDLIQDKRMTQSVVQMKKHFLSQIEDYTCLEKLVEEFDKDAILKKLLYEKAVYQAYMTQDFTIVDQIKQRYNVGKDKYVYDPLRCLLSKRKASYRIAIFFPFFVNELDYATATSSFVIDLYHGIQLAKETLAKEGIVLQFFSFDTKNNASVTRALLAQEALQHMDLIIGPLYPDTISLVSAFAKEHKINFVNPISSNAAIIQENPFAFLFHPTLERYAQKAAQLTLDDIQSKSIKEPCIAVFYTTSREDVLQATLYKHVVEQILEKPLDWFIELSDNTIKDFFTQLDKSDQLTEEETTDKPTTNYEIKKEDLAKITHIYLPSQHKLLVSNVINLPFKVGIRPQIIGHAQWIKDEIVTLHQLSKLPFLFLSTCYIDFNRPALGAFRDRFFQTTATFPTLYSYIGYEMMLFFGRMLGKYGTYFQKEWENKPYDGTLFQEVYYGKYHANQHITVLRFDGNKFVTADSLVIGSEGNTN